MNPDYYIRKYFFDALTLAGLAVYDSRTGLDEVPFYVLLTSQSKQRGKDNKCMSYFEASISIEILSVAPKTGNAISRTAINNAEELIIDAFNLANIINFEIRGRDYSSNDIVTPGLYETVIRTIVNINFKLYQK